jgi:3',5'-cyclic AMP phosphodiesterase CpdA
MPIHLPSISRRRFLLRTLAGGAGLAIAPNLARGADNAGGDNWVLMADTHIAGDEAAVSRGVNMAGHLVTAVRSVTSLSTPVQGVFILGDCALDSGESPDYATFVKLLGPVRQRGMSVHIALGNHDHRERFWDGLPAEKAVKRPVADRQTALVRSAKVNWFMLDSLEKTLVTPGFLGSDQLAWLAAALDENADRPAVVVLHHNPGRLANVEGVRDTEAFLEVLRPRKHVKACFFGHTHRWSVTQDESGIHLVNLPPVAYVFREGDPSGWIRATIAGAGAKLELNCIDPAHKAHGLTTELRWRAA